MPELRYTTTEPAGDRATLESDLSAAPEAEMGWGVRTSPALPIRRRIPHLCTKALNSGVLGQSPRDSELLESRSIHLPVSSVRSYVPTSSLSHLSAFFEA